MIISGRQDVFLHTFEQENRSLRQFPYDQGIGGRVLFRVLEISPSGLFTIFGQLICSCLHAEHTTKYIALRT